MNKIPSPFWAFLFMCLAVLLVIVVLFTKYEPNTTMAVISIASSMITGAFGYISGHAAGAQTNTTATGPNTIVNAAPDPLSTAVAPPTTK